MQTMEITDWIVRLLPTSHHTDESGIGLAKSLTGHRDSERFAPCLSSAKPEIREERGGALLFGDAQTCTDMKVRALPSRPLAWPEIGNKAALER